MEKCYCCSDDGCRSGCDCWTPCSVPYPANTEYGCEYEKDHEGPHRVLVANEGISTDGLINLNDMTLYYWSVKEKECDMMGCSNRAFNSSSFGPGTYVKLCKECYDREVEVKE